MVHPFSNNQQNVSNVLNTSLSRLNTKDPAALQSISDIAGTNDPVAIEGYRQTIVTKLQKSTNIIANEPPSSNLIYASHDPYIGLVQTNIGQVATPLDVPAIDNLANEWQQYGDGDPRWVECVIVAFFTYSIPVHPFVGSAAPASFTYVERSPSFTIAIMADWGAPNDASRAVSSQIKAKNPDYVFHLGDIYYAGTKDECMAFLAMWPHCDAGGFPIKDRSFTLNGNHEMYCGARDYFDTVLPAFNQEASYFRLVTQYWQFLGLDSAYANSRLSDPKVQLQWDWLIANLNGNPGLNNIFMTHHQPVSAHSQEFADSRGLNADGRAIIDATKPGAIYAWLFGHEHREVVYDDTVVVDYKARLIGNGSIPHDAQNETEPDPGCTPFTYVNTGTFGPGNAVSSFALLTVVGPKITVEYIDQDGSPSSIPTEVWHATAAGQPYPGDPAI